MRSSGQIRLHYFILEQIQTFCMSRHSLKCQEKEYKNIYECVWCFDEWVNIALSRFLHIVTIMAISRQKEVRSRDNARYALLLFRITSRVLYSVQYHRQYCTLHTFEQFGALYMHNHDNKYPARAGFETGTSKWYTDFSPHSQFAPFFSETFRPQLILKKDVSPPPHK